jgi:hypothetical protein
MREDRDRRRTKSSYRLSGRPADHQPVVYATRAGEEPLSKIRERRHHHG